MSLQNMLQSLQTEYTLALSMLTASGGRPTELVAIGVPPIGVLSDLERDLVTDVPRTEGIACGSAGVRLSETCVSFVMIPRAFLEFRTSGIRVSVLLY